MIQTRLHILALGCLLALVSCDRETRKSAVSPALPADAGVLLKIGSVVVTQDDLDLQLKERHAGRTDAESRQTALGELAQRASLTQAALDANLENDPIARAEIARILISRLREIELTPKLQAAANQPIPASRLREIYESRKDQFQSAEKRQVALLWLDPGPSPERVAAYQEKLSQARTWFLANEDLRKNPEQGFSFLSVDYSEHAPTRYKQGVLGWFDQKGGADPLAKAAAEIAFGLEKPGDVSEVITRPEGIFLVRYMAEKPAFTRPFESVSAELEHAERRQMRESVEADFLSTIQSRYPVSPLGGDPLKSQVSNTP